MQIKKRQEASTQACRRDTGDDPGAVPRLRKPAQGRVDCRLVIVAKHERERHDLQN
jgi:hypothetical protein